MVTIKVNSLPVDLVILDLAEAFQIPYQLNCKEYHLELTEKVGKGYIKAMMLESGLGIIEYNCQFNMDIEIQFVKDFTHPLKFLYCTKGHFDHRFSNEEQLHDLQEYQQAIVASKDYNGHVIRFQKDQEINLYSLEMDRERFTLHDECASELIKTDLEAIFGDVWATNSFYHEGYYSLALAEVFEDIKAFQDSFFLRYIFMISCGYQLLGKQIVQYQDDLNNEENRHVLRQYEVSKVKEAVQVIKQNIEKTYTISDIGREVGLTDAKLQEGFKVLYKTTVNNYINEVRLDLASSLLRDTNFNISEVVYKIGLTSRSYFSKIFREAYNMTPTEYRNMYLKKS
ncbi:helix-turn-helix transcriptional regulator [Gelidibacter salicanalis]|uniref:Helix-turn-helix transcriptional regulator n=1 Tax=Gelidibacter salicanalis TaxID=291193 RepID=A0A934KND5_9FLAO|nr:AraC family transcriptional regulator [Gelidibacter salicanalis]MBJ7882442.1 helix-turn-helix transcriptional regulator [Gelidibacter salicanalis]